MGLRITKFTVIIKIKNNNLIVIYMKIPSSL